jgi:uncharacterized protein (DUF1778 family)
MNPDRTALLIRCSREEAERIRAAAKRERRTVSGYVLNAVMSRLLSQEKVTLHARSRPSRTLN